MDVVIMPGGLGTLDEGTIDASDLDLAQPAHAPEGALRPVRQASGARLEGGVP